MKKMIKHYLFTIPKNCSSTDVSENIALCFSMSTIPSLRSKENQHDEQIG